MRYNNLLTLLVLLSPVFGFSRSTFGQHSPVVSSSSIQALQLPDVRIDSVTQHDGSTENGNSRAAHLDVLGTIGGSIRFQLLLPDEWNGRFAMGGGGGLVGSISSGSVPGASAQVSWNTPNPLL